MVWDVVLLGLSNYRIIVGCNFSSSSFKLKRGTLPLLQIGIQT